MSADEIFKLLLNVIHIAIVQTYGHIIVIPI